MYIEEAASKTISEVNRALLANYVEAIDMTDLVRTSKSAGFM